MIESLTTIVGGAVMLVVGLAIIAAIVIGYGIAILFAIGIILIILGYILGWDKEDKKEMSADEK